MAKLKLLKGRPDQSEFELDQPVVVIGRSSSCDIHFAREWVSARHAQITHHDNGHFLKDLGSKNLTLLNGKRLEANVEYPLKQNDLIKICDHLLLYLEAPTDSWASQSSQATAQLPLNLPPPDEDHDKDSSASSTIDSSSGSWELRSGSNPEGKLLAMMRVTRNLHDAASLEDMQAKVLDSLLGIFSHACCGIVAVTEQTEKVPRVATIRHRDLPEVADGPRIDQDLISKVLASQSGAIVNQSECSLMCAPLVSVSGESLGVIQVETQPGIQQFSRHDLDLLAHIALQTSFAIETIRLHEQLRRDRELQGEMATAYHIQLSLLPTERPRVPGYSFEDFYNPAREIGGDYYDYVQLRDGRLAIVIGDVAGKGVPAALIVASVTTLLKVMLAGNESPREVMNQLNHDFEDRFGEQLYLTMLVATLDPESGRIEIINAGHLPPLLKSRTGSVRLVERRANGLALGILPDTSYGLLELKLDPGDSLVFYTDGITEARNADGDDYRLARLQDVMARLESQATKLCQGILSDVWDFTGNETQSDDICLLCVSRDAN